MSSKHSQMPPELRLPVDQEARREKGPQGNKIKKSPKSQGYQEVQDPEGEGRQGQVLRGAEGLPSAEVPPEPQEERDHQYWQPAAYLLLEQAQIATGLEGTVPKSFNTRDRSILPVCFGSPRKNGLLPEHRKVGRDVVSSRD